MSSKITTEEIKTALAELFDKGDWEMDVSDDVAREFDKRMPTVMSIISKQNDRIARLEAGIQLLLEHAKIEMPAAPAAEEPARGGRVSKAPAAKPTATIKVRVGSVR